MKCTAATVIKKGPMIGLLVKEQLRQHCFMVLKNVMQ